jgi:hypothetical protein
VTALGGRDPHNHVDFAIILMKLSVDPLGMKWKLLELVEEICAKVDSRTALKELRTEYSARGLAAAEELEQRVMILRLWLGRGFGLSFDDPLATAS